MTYWDNARSILCVRLDSMGDVLMTTPALRALKEGIPDRRLTLLSSPSGVEMGQLIPEIDDVLCYQAPWLKATPLRSSSVLDRQFCDDLRSRHFDAAVIFTVFSQNPLPAAQLCYLADIPLRLAHCRENPYQLLTHWVPETEPQNGIRHEVQRQLDLVEQIGCTTTNTAMSCHVPPPALATVLELLDRQGVVPSGPWMVLHPGATAASRRYPVELFAKCAAALRREGFEVIITGGVNEAPLIEQLQRLTPQPLISLAGKLNLDEMAALLSLAPVLITNNTGPAHLGAALGTPVVDLYALTNPQHTPWQTPSRVLFQEVDCKYCFKSVCPEQHHNCLRQVPPERVVKAALELYAEAQIATFTAVPERESGGQRGT